MTGDLLVRGGTLVDGTGAAARAADVRVRGGVIAEVGQGLDPAGETVIDAGGAFVAVCFPVGCITMDRSFKPNWFLAVPAGIIAAVFSLVSRV